MESKKPISKEIKDNISVAIFDNGNDFTYSVSKFVRKKGDKTGQFFNISFFEREVEIVINLLNNAISKKPTKEGNKTPSELI